MPSQDHGTWVVLSCDDLFNMTTRVGSTCPDEQCHWNCLFFNSNILVWQFKYFWFSISIYQQNCLQFKHFVFPFKIWKPKNILVKRVSFTAIFTFNIILLYFSCQVQINTQQSRTAGWFNLLHWKSIASEKWNWFL